MNDFEAYSLARRKRVQRFQKGFALVAVVSFLFSTSSVMLHTFSGALQQDQTPQTTEAQARTAEQKAEIEGYLSVLKREPDNLTALDGLAAAYIQSKDWKSAIEPLEKLAKLSPNKQSYEKLLVDVKAKAGEL